MFSSYASVLTLKSLEIYPRRTTILTRRDWYPNQPETAGAVRELRMGELNLRPEGHCAQFESRSESAFSSQRIPHPIGNSSALPLRKRPICRSLQKYLTDSKRFRKRWS